MQIQSKKVLTILTGGTAGMRRNSDGSLAPVKGYLNETLQTILKTSHSSYTYPQIAVMEYDTQLDSADMGPEDWKKIAFDIEKNYLKFDGFVVVMGTVSLIKYISTSC